MAVTSTSPPRTERQQRWAAFRRLLRESRTAWLYIAPAGLYRSNVRPVSTEGVTTLKVVYELDGAICRVIQRPFNIRAEQSLEVIRELDKIIDEGKAIRAGMALGRIGRVVGTAGDNTIEVKLRAIPREVPGAKQVSPEEMLEAETV